MAFDKSVVVPLGVDATFELITQPERLRRWQTVAARVDLRAGGDYRWTVVPGHSASGTFVEVVPGKRVVFTWGWEEGSELLPGESTVTVTLRPTDGGTEVRLVHEGLTSAQEVSHAEGWNHYLDRLVRAGASGDAGPDDWAAAPDRIDELSSAEATLAVVQHVLRGMTDDDLQAQTPCTEFTVAQLAEHLLGSIVSIGKGAGATFDVDASGPMESRIADAAQIALEEYRRRGLEGTVPLGPHGIPAAIAVGILSIEFLVHAWDFANATGQEVVVSEPLATYVLGLAAKVIRPETRGGAGFADEVVVAETASSLERLAAFTGRRPLTSV